MQTCAQRAGKTSLQENLETLTHAPPFYQPAIHIESQRTRNIIYANQRTDSEMRNKKSERNSFLKVRGKKNFFSPQSVGIEL